MCLAHVTIPICVAMIASLIIAQTLIPMVTSRFPAPPPIAAGTVLGRLQDLYTRTLDWSISTVVDRARDRAGARLGRDPDDAGEDRHVPAGRGTQSLPHLPPQGQLPARARRVGGQHHRVVSRQEPRELRHQDDLFVFPPRRCRHLRDPRAQGPGPETREVLDAITKEMPEIIIGKPSFKFDQQAGERFSVQLTGDSTEKLAELSVEVARQLRASKGSTACAPRRATATRKCRSSSIASARRSSA